MTSSSVLRASAVPFVPSSVSGYNSTIAMTMNPLAKSVVPTTVSSKTLETDALRLKSNAPVLIQHAQPTFNPCASVFVPRFKLNPQATTFIPNSRITSFLNPLAPVFARTGSAILDPHALLFVPRHVFNPCAVPFIPTQATDPQPLGAALNIEITEHTGQLLKRAYSLPILPGLQPSVHKLYPIREDIHERQRQDFSTMMNDEYQPHHYSWTGKPVYHKTDTAAALSLAIIMSSTKSTGLIHGPHNDLQKSVRTCQAFSFIDPVIYTGPVNLLTNLSGSKLRDAATGFVDKFYSCLGWWLEDIWYDDDQVPGLDQIDADEYDGEHVILNGWHANHAVPLREDFIIADFHANVEADEERKARFKKAIIRGPSKSRLDQCIGRDDLELPVMLDMIISHSTCKAETSSGPSETQPGIILNWADNTDEPCVLVDEAQFDWRSRCIDLEGKSDVDLSIDDESFSFPGLTSGATNTIEDDTEVTQGIAEDIKNPTSSYSDSVYDNKAVDPFESVGTQFNSVEGSALSVFDEEDFEASLEVNFESQHGREISKSPPMTPLARIIGLSEFSDEDLSELEAFSPIKESEITRIIASLSPPPTEVAKTEFQDNKISALTLSSTTSPATPPQPETANNGAPRSESAPSSFWTICKAPNHSRSVSLGDLPAERPAPSSEPRLPRSKSIFDLRSAAAVSDADEAFLAPISQSLEEAIMKLIAEAPQPYGVVGGDESEYESKVDDYTTRLRSSINSFEETQEVRNRICAYAEALRRTRPHMRQSSLSGDVEVMSPIPDSPEKFIVSQRPDPPTPTRMGRKGFESFKVFKDSDSSQSSKSLSSDEASIASSPPPSPLPVRRVSFGTVTFYPADIEDAEDSDESSSTTSYKFPQLPPALSLPIRSSATTALSINDHLLVSQEAIGDCDSIISAEDQFTSILDPTPSLPTFKAIRPKKSLGRRVSGMVTEGLRKVSPTLSRINIEADKPKKKSVMMTIKTSLKKALTKKMNVLK